MTVGLFIDMIYGGNKQSEDLHKPPKVCVNGSPQYQKPMDIMTWVFMSFHNFSTHEFYIEIVF